MIRKQCKAIGLGVLAAILVLSFGDLKCKAACQHKSLGTLSLSRSLTMKQFKKGPLYPALSLIAWSHLKRLAVIK